MPENGDGQVPERPPAPSEAPPLPQGTRPLANETLPLPHETLPFPQETWPGDPAYRGYDVAGQSRSFETDDEQRRRRSKVWTALIAIAVALAAIFAGLAIATPKRNTPAARSGAVQLAQEALSSAQREGSFHYLSVYEEQGTTQTTNGHAAPFQGRQDITVGTQKFTVLVIDNTAYFDGDALSMQQQLDLLPSEAARYSGQWISLAPTDAPYQSIYVAVTTQSALSQNINFNPLRQATAQLQGSKALTVSGPVDTVSGQAASGSATLWLQAKGTHLPLQYEEDGKVGGHGFTLKMTFDRWGENTQVYAPAQPIPFSSLSSIPATPEPTQLT